MISLPEDDRHGALAAPRAIARYRGLQIEPVGQADCVQQAVMMGMEAPQPDPSAAPPRLPGRLVQHGEAAAIDEIDVREVDDQPAQRSVHSLHERAASRAGYPEI